MRYQRVWLPQYTYIKFIGLWSENMSKGSVNNALRGVENSCALWIIEFFSTKKRNCLTGKKPITTILLSHSWSEKYQSGIKSSISAHMMTTDQAGNLDTKKVKNEWGGNIFHQLHLHYFFCTGGHIFWNHASLAFDTDLPLGSTQV